MPPEDARALVDEVKGDIAAVWLKLAALYAAQAHTSLGYPSWGAFFEAEFETSASYGYRLIESAEVVRQLPIGEPRPANEAVARELVGLRGDPDLLRQVWAEAVARYGDHPTAKQVRALKEQVRRALAPPPELPDPKPTTWRQVAMENALRTAPQLTRDLQAYVGGLDAALGFLEAVEDGEADIEDFRQMMLDYRRGLIAAGTDWKPGPWLGN